MSCLRWLLPVMTAMIWITVAASAESIHVWIGTATPPHGMSKGIYHLTLDTETGRLSDAALAAEILDPGFLEVNVESQRLYSTGNIDSQPVVVAYEVDGPKLNFLNSQPIGDGGAAHLSINTAGKFLLTAQYGGGSVAVFPLDEAGAVEPRSQLIEHQEASQADPRRQAAPHPHWTGFDPGNRFAFVPDLGLDAVLIYRMDLQNRRLTPHGRGIVPSGAGPRHMKFHPSGQYAYVLNELDLTITTFAYDPEAGTMTPIETVRTLTEEEQEQESTNSASEIRVHPSGRFLYTANRGHDTISVFRVDPSQRGLTRVDVEPVRGAWPRNFNIDPSGKWLLVAGRDSHTLAVFAIHQETGELTFSRHIAFVPFPICVEFGA